MDTHSWLPDVPVSPSPGLDREETAPLVTVARGNPTDDELAALVAVLAAVTRPAEDGRLNDDRPIAGGWKSYWHTVRQPFIPAREVWRGSLR